MTLVDMGHTVPGTMGIVARWGVLYLTMVAHEARSRVRKNGLRCKASVRLNCRVPNQRLHISGEKYVVH